MSGLNCRLFKVTCPYCGRVMSYDWPPDVVACPCGRVFGWEEIERFQIRGGGKRKG